MKYRQPANEDEFEEFCLALLRRHWNCPSLERYAHRGECQSGVDIIDQSGRDPLRGAQCKHHKSNATLPPSKLRAEVEKAKEFRPPLGYYCVLTTAKKSRATQDALIAINREHAAMGLFAVDLLTWEAIEGLLDDYPEVRERLEKIPAPVWKDSIAGMQHHLASVAVDVKAIAAAMPEAGSETIERELADAKASLERWEYHHARLLMARLKERRWGEMQPRQRYRLLVNTAGAFIGEGNLKEAGKRLLEAAMHVPDEPDAQALAAFGHEMLDERAKAYDLAGEILKRSSTVSRAAAVRVRTSPDPVTLDDLEREIPSAAIDQEASVALSVRALNQKDNDRARHYAERATEEGPKWPPAWLMLGKAHLAGEVSKFQGTAEAGGNAVDNARLADAERYFTRALELAKEQKTQAVLVEALLSRAQARAFLGLDETADIEEAHRVAPNDPAVLVEYSIVQRERQDIEGAIASLRRAVTLGGDGRAQFMLAASLWPKRDPASRIEAIELFRQLALRRDEPYHQEAATHALRGLIGQSAWADAEALIDELEPHIAPTMTAVLAATLAQAQNRIDEAREQAFRANASIAGDTSAFTLRSVAKLLSSLGLFPQALPLWQRLFIPNCYTEDTQNLIACADRVGRHDLVIETCRTLRENGAGTPDLFQMEAALLERYDPPAAMALLQQQLADDPSDRVSRLRLSMIGLRVGREDLVAKTLDELPSVDEMEPEWVPAVIHVLHGLKRTNDAIAFAYRCLRGNFDRHETHLAFLQSMEPGARPEPSIKEPAAVALGTAVCYREDGTDQARWLVIEDDTHCYEALGEVRADHHLAQRLMGKRPGEKAVLVEGGVQDRTATILQVLHKYVYRYNDVLQNWQFKFPKEHYVQMVRLASTEDPTDGHLDFKPIFKSVDDRYNHAQHVLEAYAQNSIPIHCAAEALGQSDIEMAFALAAQPQTRIRCGTRTDDEIAQILDSLRAGSTLIADPVAVATILLLEAERTLARLSPSVLVSFGINDELNRLLARYSNPALLGTIGKVPGGYAVEERSPKERMQTHAHLAEQIATLRAGSQLAGCPALAALDPARREDLVGVFGSATLESMVNAAAPGRLLWTDDFTVAAVAKSEFGVKTVSTELVLRHWAETGLRETHRLAVRTHSGQSGSSARSRKSQRMEPRPLSVQAGARRLWRGRVPFGGRTPDYQPCRRQVFRRN